MDFPGRLLGIDHGLKVIGLATCDRTGFLATPLTILKRTSKQADFAFITSVIKREEIVGVVVGLPPRPPEFVGVSQSTVVQNWAKRLAAVIAVPVYLWDEGLSSVDATELLRGSGKKLPDRIDAYAAAVILQSFLDARREGLPFPTPLAVEKTSDD